MCGISRVSLVPVFLYLFIELSLNQEDPVFPWSWRYSGDRCEWKGVKGTCVNFWTCSTNALDAVTGNHPPVCYHRNGEVFSCCTACQLTANISDHIVLVDYGTIKYKTGKKSTDKCYEYMFRYRYPCNSHKSTSMKLDKELSGDCYLYTIRYYGHASNGRNARREEYPHMALLGYGEDQESAQWLCGGSIISEHFILTAAHCGYAERLGAVSYVAVGILKRSDPREMWQIYSVASFIPHPDRAPPSKYHDIALIKTDRPIKMGNSVLPACLPYGDEKITNAYATGWGATGHRAKVADVLQSVNVTSYNASQCFEHYGPRRHLSTGYNDTIQMCYGDSMVGRDTCEGDSGGPLQLETCPHVIIGVTSSGHPCGFPDSPGLYTRVQHYLKWIEDIVWP